MFRKMRRIKQLLPAKKAEEILIKGLAGVLAVSGDDGYPYAVPLSYVYENDKIYFHSAKSGHKIDGIQRDAKVSFCVIDKDQIVPEKMTTYFRSAIAFGRARILTDDTEIIRAMQLLAKKYSPVRDKEASEAIESERKSLLTVEILIEHLTGKQAIELVEVDD